MTPPVSCWTSSPGNWSLKVLWTDAPVPGVSSASHTGEVPSVDSTGGAESSQNIIQGDSGVGLARRSY